jgi:hypothetical protein
VVFMAPKQCTNSEDNWSISINSQMVRFLQEPKRPSLDQPVCPTWFSMLYSPQIKSRSMHRIERLLA